MSEGSEVVKPILEALAKVPGVVAWRCQSGKVRVRGGFMQLAPVGTPDIIGFMRDSYTADTVMGAKQYKTALFFGIECKKPGSKTDRARAEAQAAWGQTLVDHGGIYVRAFSVAEALAGLGLT